MVLACKHIIYLGHETGEAESKYYTDYHMAMNGILKMIGSFPSDLLFKEFERRFSLIREITLGLKSKQDKMAFDSILEENQIDDKLYKKGTVILFS
jgi:myosin heavy subunit